MSSNTMMYHTVKVPYIIQQIASIVMRDIFVFMNCLATSAKEAQTSKLTWSNEVAISTKYRYHSVYSPKSQLFQDSALPAIVRGLHNRRRGWSKGSQEKRHGYVVIYGYLANWSVQCKYVHINYLQYMQPLEFSTRTTGTSQNFGGSDVVSLSKSKKQCSQFNVQD